MQMAIFHLAAGGTLGSAYQAEVVVSETGQGSTFTIDLPALRDSSRALEVPAE